MIEYWHRNGVIYAHCPEHTLDGEALNESALRDLSNWFCKAGTDTEAAQCFARAIAARKAFMDAKK